MPIFRSWRVTRRWLIAVLLCWLSIAGLITPTQAQMAVELEAEAYYEGNYLRGKWLPISIVLRNLGPDREVLIAVAGTGSGARSVISRSLPGGAEQQLLLYAAMGDQTTQVTVRVESEGETLAQQQVPVRPRANERTTAIVSTVPLQLSLPLRQELFAYPLLPLPLDPSALPDNPLGLTSLTQIILSDVPTTELSVDQGRALWSWVQSGGHLVIGGGPGATRTLDGLPSELRAANLGANVTLDGAALAAFANLEEAPDLPGVTLEPIAGGVPNGEPATPLWVTRPLGNGQITQLAFEPGLEVLQDWEDAPIFWELLLRPPLQLSGAGSVETSPDVLRQQLMTGALSYLPPINLPPAEPLFVALALYVILIGPGLALLLRRLDRQAWGWVLLPVFVIGSGLIAMTVAVSLRANERITNQISVIEQIGPDFARVRTVAAVIGPQDGRYPLTTIPEASTRPLLGGSGTVVTVSGAGGDMVQQSTDMILESEPWRLQGLVGSGLIEWPAVESRIIIDEAGIRAEVRNTTPVILRDVVLILGEQFVELGTLAPGEEASTAWRSPGEQNRPPIGRTLSESLLGSQLAEARSAGNLPNRELLIRDTLLAAVSERGSAPAEFGPFVLAWVDRSPLPLTIAAEGSASQEVTLLRARPTIVFNERGTLPVGWLRLDPLASDRGACTGPRGRGVLAAPEPVELILRLPSELGNARAGQMTLLMTSDREWPNAGVLTEIYNWRTGAWVDLNFDGPGSLTIADGADFLAFGESRLRLSGRIFEANCLFIEARLTLVPEE